MTAARPSRVSALRASLRMSMRADAAATGFRDLRTAGIRVRVDCPRFHHRHPLARSCLSSAPKTILLGRAQNGVTA